jgi:hypothetical protein
MAEAAVAVTPAPMEGHGVYNRVLQCGNVQGEARQRRRM